MKTHRYTESIQNSHNETGWKTSRWKTKSRMNVTLTICLGDEMFGNSVFECALSVLLTAVLLSSLCERSLLQMADLEPVARSVSQSAVVDPPGAASYSVMHRHATRQVCRKPNYTVIQQLDTRNVDCDRQTDTLYVMLILLCLFTISSCDWPPLEY